MSLGDLFDVSGRLERSGRGDESRLGNFADRLHQRIDVMGGGVEVEDQIARPECADVLHIADHLGHGSGERGTSSPERAIADVGVRAYDEPEVARAAPVGLGGAQQCCPLGLDLVER
jgi:hypothetical protein